VGRLLQDLTNTHTHTHTHTHTQHTHTHTYIHTYIHAYRQTDRHTYIQRASRASYCGRKLLFPPPPGSVMYRLPPQVVSFARAIGRQGARQRLQHTASVWGPVTQSIAQKARKGLLPTHPRKHNAAGKEGIEAWPLRSSTLFNTEVFLMIQLTHSLR
jgi:hypothetical protein